MMQLMQKRISTFGDVFGYSVVSEIRKCPKRLKRNTIKCNVSTDRNFFDGCTS